MHALLKSTCEIPVPKERSLRFAEQINPVLSNEVRRRLRYMHIQSFDQEQGGLLSPIKFIDRDSTEYSLAVANDQDKNEERMARITLDNASALLDPVWGGVYQYSTQGKWDVPHYRKTMAAQAGHLRLYSLAYAQMKLNRYKEVCDSIQTYIKDFMTSGFGAFYTGQSDCIAGINPMLFFSLSNTNRKKIGIPEIDKRIHTRENGWIIEALATHYEYCGNQKSLIMAINAARWINRHCRHQDYGYLTNTMVQKPLYLSDTLSMARAMLQLYRVTLDSQYLRLACDSARFINRNFKNEICGYNCKLHYKNEITPTRQIDENISLTRFANLLSYYSDEPLFSKMAKHGLRYLCIPEIATSRMEEAGILLIDREMSSTPLTIRIHGKRYDPVLKAFIKIAHRNPTWYKLIKVNSSTSASASIEIDGIRSKAVTSPEKLQRLLQDH
ncbi:MAG: hypothetical protein DHS20C09_18200 [marine bacterium B5-7]|nr:MAG: hypothetical protein DHS20C09_18200 [marine bacterium B5-7]